jgi:hypothetical protein
MTGIELTGPAEERKQSRIDLVGVCLGNVARIASTGNKHAIGAHVFCSALAVRRITMQMTSF